MCPMLTSRVRLASWSALALAANLALAAPAGALEELSAGNPASLLNLDDAFVSDLEQPTALIVLPDGRMVITLKKGPVMVRPAAGGALVQAGSFTVNWSVGEQGLLNVIAHPDFVRNRVLFFYYSAAAGGVAPPAGTGGGSDEARNRVVSVELGTDNRLSMSTQRVLIDGLRGHGNHVGGALSIHADKLFVGVGDSLERELAACFSSGNGKVLRVNLDGSVPDDNPLVGVAATPCSGTSGLREEIWAWGFRNPWRIWADPRTGNVWVGDVGDEAHEEIDVIAAEGGGHFGWPGREAATGAPVATACASVEPGGPCIDPVYSCAHPTDCKSITGGVILRGCQWPAAFEGRYVFGDFNRQRLWSMAVTAAGNALSGARQNLVEPLEGTGPVHFVEHDGSLYYVAHGGVGHISRISPKAPEPPCTNMAGGSGGAGGGGDSIAGGSPSAGSGGTQDAPGSAGQGGEGGSPDEPGGAPSPAAGGAAEGGAPDPGTAEGRGGRAPAGAAGGGGAGGGKAGSGESGCGCQLAKGHAGGLASLVGALSWFALLTRRRHRRSR